MSTTVQEAFPALAAGGLGFIDVGSRGGFQPMLKEIAPLLELVGFEPDPVECRGLNAQAVRLPQFRSVRHLPFALGSADGSRVLHVCRLAGTSSFYLPNRTLLDRFPEASRFDVIETREIPTRSLDSLRDGATGEIPRFVGFLKIDTQGAELEVLSGAQGLLRQQAVGVEVEVAFSSLYRSQPVFRDVDAFLSELGFTLFKLRRYNWTRRQAAAHPASNAGQTVFADALYLKDPLAEEPAGHIGTPQQAEALVVMAALFDLHDFALELAADRRLSTMISAALVWEYVASRSERLRRHTPRRATQALLSGIRACWANGGDLKYLLPLLRRHHRSWARGDADFYTQL